ncbi:MAG: hypothetical protein ACLUFN_04680 [Eubacterium sp.]
MKTITDLNGKTHRMLTNRIDNVRLYIAVYNLDAIYVNICNDIPKDIADDFLDVSKRLERLLGTMQCDETTDVFIIEQGYDYEN